MLDNELVGNEINNDFIDPLMVKTIDILNQKGYVTAYCCQGHYDSKYPNMTNGYIKFEYDVICKLLKRYKKVRLPRGVKFESIHIIRFRCDGAEEEQEKQIISINKALERWADRLPNITDIINS